MRTIERINRVYRIMSDGKLFLLVDCIGQVYGRYDNAQSCRDYAKHLMMAEIAQRRELQGWDANRSY